MARTDRLHLGVFLLPTGHHVAAWRHRDAAADASINLEHYMDLARLAERGRLDFIFLADAKCVRTGNPEVMKRSAHYIAGFEPITLLSAIAAVTSRIGLVATATTSYNEPYNVARSFASLDHLSGGRAGWNMVTSSHAEEAMNFGRKAHYGHAERYMRAEEFASVVKGLWDSWDDDAFLRDKQEGLFFELSKVHALNHRGAYFDVAGPLNVPRPPQGHPIVVQAGASPEGKELGSRYADVIFTNHFTLSDAKAFYRDMKDRAARHGRNPAHLKIMPGLSVFVGRTADEAEEKYEAMQQMVDPAMALEILSNTLNGADLTDVPFDGPLPDNLKLAGSHGSQSGYENWVRLARRENLTVRELAYRALGSRGKAAVKDTANGIADFMQEWFEEGACDGFNFMPAPLPGGLADVVDRVIPELQRRGLFRTEYRGSMLRDHLGLPRPHSRYEPVREAAG